MPNLTKGEKAFVCFLVFVVLYLLWEVVRGMS
jgi:hypothetical protein